MIETYDQIRIINLVARADRRRQMISELRRLGLGADPRVEFFAAVVPDDAGPWPNPGARGCYMSHLSILRAAQAVGASVLILEDDCDFTEAALKSQWGQGSDIFCGGFGATDYANLDNSDIQGSHCIGFDRAVIGRLIRFLEDLTHTTSPPPIDGAYVEFRRANPDVRTEFARPQVAIQRQSSSDISPGRFDRNKLSRLAVGLLRKLNRGRNRRRRMMDGL